MHGLSTVIEVISNNHGKMNVDIGSIWKDTVNREWTILKIIDENKIVLLSKNRLTYPDFNFYISITGDLTHVLNATNTSTITITSQAAGEQIPVVKNRTFTIKLNGYILPNTLQNNVASLKKFRNKSKLIFTTEVVSNAAELLPNAETYNIAYTDPSYPQTYENQFDPRVREIPGTDSQNIRLTATGSI
jgi:hypothetical protein